MSVVAGSRHTTTTTSIEPRRQDRCIPRAAVIVGAELPVIVAARPAHCTAAGHGDAPTTKPDLGSE